MHWHGTSASTGPDAAPTGNDGQEGTVFQSSVGAEQRHGLGELDGLGAAEEALDVTGASVVHLRCGYFFTNLVDFADALAQGVLPTAFPVDLAQPWVDPRDIAAVATGRLLSTSWSGHHVQAVHGPEDLTFDRAATVIARVTGRNVGGTANHRRRIRPGAFRYRHGRRRGGRSGRHG